MKVSVILPTYNESGNIVKLVSEIIRVLSKHYIFEVLVVDDNSPDGTHDLVKREFRKDKRVKPVLRTKDRGFAKSIRAGIEKASFDQVIVMDTDFTHDPKEIPNLLHVGQIYDFVSGSRFAPGGNMQSTGHYLVSLLYNWLLRIILRTQVQDNLGGYFTTKKKYILDLPRDIIFQGYGEYYFRLIFFLQRRKKSVVEIPAIYATRSKGKSKSNFLKMMIIYLHSALKLKFSHQNS